MHQMRNKKSSYHSAKPLMSSLMLLVLLLAATAATVDCLSAIPGCQGVCGGVEIPYPFGIGSTCSRKGFEIDCINNGSAGEIPVLPAPDQNIPVLQLSVSPFPVARVLLPVAWRCFNSTGDVTGIYAGDVNFNPEGVYRISNTENELFVLGCNTYAYTNGVRVYNARFRYKYFTGCITVTNDKTDPRDGACAGLGCCRVDIPPGITDTSMSISGWSHADQEFCPCDYAFIVEKGNYTFKASDLLSTHIPNNQTTPLSVNWTMPLSLDWAIRDNGSTSISCAEAPNKPEHDYACRSNRSTCFDSTNGPGYICNCTQGYQGNPYIVGGCTNINECQFPESYYCPSGSKCIDMDGTYKCQCKLFRRGKECRPIIPTTVVALIATFVAVVTACFAFVLLQTQKHRKLFNINGGDVLKGVGISIFSKRELRKITNGYSDRIGGGFFGDVYKGIIKEGAQTKLVAVKCTVEKKEARRRQKELQGDAPQHEQVESWKEGFVKEITFQFRNNHPNMVCLVGCCLETNIPILVFEFVSNGSLDKKLHGANKHCTLSLQQRLNIAIGSAKALSHMHSNGEYNHVHGDIKPANILLDEDLNAKVSDFGSSKLLSAKMYAEGVFADGNYLDPAYYETGHFTIKSDVYSFGVVLLELITRKPARYNGNNSLPAVFENCWKDEVKRRSLYDTDILSNNPLLIKCLDMVGALALECLNADRDKRPTMGDVVVKLEMVRSIASGGSCAESSETEPLLDEASEKAGMTVSFSYYSI